MCNVYCKHTKALPLYPDKYTQLSSLTNHPHQVSFQNTFSLDQDNFRYKKVQRFYFNQTYCLVSHFR